MSESFPPGSDDAEELSELSRELRKGHQPFSRGLDELEYDDLTWSSDPVDAGPGFKRSNDIALGEQGYMDKGNSGSISQQAAKQRRMDNSKWSSIRRIDNARMRCDARLKDITESKRLDTRVLGANDRLVPGYPEFHTKILSRLFWPAMNDEVFNVPPKIYELQRRYERAFESLKKKHKLT